MQHRQFGRGRTNVETAGSANITDPDVSDVSHPIVVNVVDNRRVYGVYRAIVRELIMVPIAAFIPTATITMAVIDAAIEADMQTPIPVIPVIAAGRKCPVGRGPERADIGSHYPNAGHPIVASRRISPIARCPEIILTGTFGLGVLRNRRRGLFCHHRRLLIIGVARARVVVIVAIVGRLGPV
jgi:hypothetical protein